MSRTLTNGLSLSAFYRPPFPWWLAMMRVNANAARCCPSLGIDVLVAEGDSTIL